MYQGRLTRNLISILLFLIALIITLLVNFSPKKIPNYVDLMSGTLSYSAIATALLFACFSLIPALSNSKLINVLQDLGTDMKLMDRLLVSTFLFFVVSILSLINLFFTVKDDCIISSVFCSLWLSFLIAASSEVFQILGLMFTTLKVISARK